MRCAAPGSAVVTILTQATRHDGGSLGMPAMTAVDRSIMCEASLTLGVATWSGAPATRLTTEEDLEEAIVAAGWTVSVASEPKRCYNACVLDHCHRLSIHLVTTCLIALHPPDLI